MLKATYKCFSVENQPVMTTVTLPNGAKADVPVDRIVIQLVGEAGTVRLVDDGAPDFSVGDMVEATFVALPATE